MIRIYLDWGAVSTLKEEHEKVFDFIKTNKERLLFPYTPAHFNDLLKSSDNDKVFQDLNNLNYLCEKHHMRWVDDDLKLQDQTPQEYFNKHSNPNSISVLSLFEDFFNGKIEEGSLLSILIKSIVELTRSYSDEKFNNEESRQALKTIYPEMMRDYPSEDIVEKLFMFSRRFERERDVYKDYRKSFQQEGVKLNSDAGNWDTEDVIANIDKHLQTFDSELTFKRYVEMSVRTFKKEAFTNYDLFIFSYMILDLLGYKQDKLPKKTNSVKNIFNDAEHSFYGAYCDYFISNDRNLRKKAAILYREFQVPTKVLSSDEFIDSMNEVFFDHKSGSSFINDALDLLTKENIKPEEPVSNPFYPNAEKVEYRLPKFYFNFFHTAVIYSHLNNHQLFIELKKTEEVSYRQFYKLELEKLWKNIYMNIMGEEELNISSEHLNKFIEGNENIVFEWPHQNGYFQLKRESPDFEPIFVFAIQLGESKI
jgi:hypothetical protein